MNKLIFLALWAGDWTAPVAVLHELKPVVSYRARWTGEHLAVEARLEPGWHTFAMDNEKRAQEKLAGKMSLGIDRQTEIKLGEGLAAADGWLQSVPKDFSKPELRWFTWGFEEKALFVAKARRDGKKEGHVEIRGQACTDTVCKNIDVSIVVPVGEGRAEGIDLRGLIPVGR